jgi:hypothetical protein
MNLHRSATNEYTEQLIRDKWRSQAVRALTARRAFKENQTREVEEIIRSARESMLSEDVESSCILDGDAFFKHDDIFVQDIFNTAVKLHQGMRSSIHQYKVQRLELDQVKDAEQVLDKGWTLKDLDDWVEVKKIECPAQLVYCIYPSVVRQPDGHGQSLTLVAPVFVVEFQTQKHSVTSSFASSMTPSLQPLSRADLTDTETSKPRHQGRASNKITVTSSHSEPSVTSVWARFFAFNTSPQIKSRIAKSNKPAHKSERPKERRSRPELGIKR